MRYPGLPDAPEGRARCDPSALDTHAEPPPAALEMQDTMDIRRVGVGASVRGQRLSDSQPLLQRLVLAPLHTGQLVHRG